MTQVLLQFNVTVKRDREARVRKYECQSYEDINSSCCYSYKTTALLYVKNLNSRYQKSDDSIDKAKAQRRVVSLYQQAVVYPLNLLHSFLR